MFFTNNISTDQFWWWWVIHLWVEATWEVFVGVLIAYGLIKVLHANRKIVEMWLYIEVTMLFGSGILGLGHHYFWIGTPEYWWEIGALFSALEPVPLVGMLVHVIYDMGKHGGKVNNGPAFNWFIVNAFGNFLGAGIWGFMHTLPQINIYTHGSQFTAAHGHLAFYGAYATILIGMMYVAIQRKNNIENMKSTSTSKWAISLVTIGVVGMTVALTTSGYIQAFVERGEYGATWDGYFIAQQANWFLQGIGWRLAMGFVTFVGFLLLVKDMLTIGARSRALANK
jgi:nitric oxide reductase subunit B